MFVGRVAELDLLVGAVQTPPVTVVLLGPPGIGKTTLVEHVVERAQSSGTLVAWGRVWEFGGAPPFFPWERVFTTLAERVPSCADELVAVATSMRDGSDDVGSRQRVALFEAHALPHARRVRRDRPGFGSQRLLRARVRNQSCRAPSQNGLASAACTRNRRQLTFTTRDSNCDA